MFEGLFNRIVVEYNTELAESLEKIGVAILNEDGEMKTMSKLLEDISEVWDEMVEK